ncbi:amidohydrolase family protein [Cohnella hashimotonis]|uniref:Amidohydrolase family protein n=1 Tax=Cohnella hashimotonis TaxID=2826895 RepID=A0ABT6T9P1_9BACL|nr:amidohydrolase family protein [Cohnella hashimotonis]MDI4643536.1 amidohydrolase family protein [Cohnella hashimotonis]
MNRSIPLIDVHHHIVSPPVLAQMKRLGIPKPSILPDWSPGFSLEKMAEANIDLSILSAPGAPDFLPPEEISSVLREVNDYFASLVSAHPTKFGAFGTLPMHSGEAAAREAAYALDTLKLEGVAFQSSWEDKYLSHPDYEELLAELDRREAVAFIHPILLKQNIAGLSPALLEGTFDTTRNVTTMAVHRIFDRYPRIKFIIPHTGGMVPYIKWRIAAAVIHAEHLEETPESYEREMAKLDRLYYDTTLNLGPLQKLIPHSQILFGADIPFPSEAVVRYQIDSVLKDAAEYGEENVKAIAFGNALRLFPRLREAFPQASSPVL